MFVAQGSIIIYRRSDLIELNQERINRMEISKEEMRDRLGNLDQIRDILFGSQLRDYETRFNKLESALTTLEQAMGDRIEKLNESLSGEIRSTADSIERKLKYLSLTTHEQITDVRQEIYQTTQNFNSNLENLDRNLKNQINSIKEDLTQSKDKINQDIESLRSQIFTELEKGFNNLKEGKVSREDLAEILFDLCMRVRGTEFVPDLKEASGQPIKTDFILPEQHDN